VAAGRGAEEVRILLASKTQPAERVRTVLEAARSLGLPVLLGENRVQELVAKGPALADLEPEWHLIGPLQSNKVNHALAWARAVESVASLELAERIARRLAPGRGLDLFVQVNVSGEPTKSGVAPQEAVDLALAVAALEGPRLRGFMTIGAHTQDMAVVRAGFARLREVRDAVVASGAPGTGQAVELSMGMSGDLEAAVAEGATIVRLGTAVFGPRS
jgi:pyridoxal phosphate enzyme, YggS family